MSYFRNLVTIVRSKLPLLIDQVEWDGTSFYMGGKGWHYNSLADWVIVNKLAMIIGCHDNDIENLIAQQIIGKKVIDLLPSLEVPAYDPVFILSNEIQLKFFSTSIIDPWTLKLEGEDMFVASPSDIEWIFR